MKFILLAILCFGSAQAQTPQNHRKELSALDGQKVLITLSKNDDLFNSFLKKDQKGIEKAASELYAIVSKTDVKVLGNVKKEAKSLLNIKSTNSNDVNLVHYERFLNPLIELVKSHNVDAKFNIFHCPMVEKSWIQNVAINKNVKNVYAMEMLECGTQKTNF